MTSEYYDIDVRLKERELNLLFHRFNFFIAATAFLITAYATVVVTAHFFSSAEPQSKLKTVGKKVKILVVSIVKWASLFREISILIRFLRKPTSVQLFQLHPARTTVWIFLTR